MSLVNEPQRIAITAYFFLVTVAQSRFADNHWHDSILLDGHAFDPVGRDGAFDQRMLPQRLETLRRLQGEELLLPPCLAEISQCPRDRGGHFGLRCGHSPQGHHSGTLDLTSGLAPNGTRPFKLAAG